ncbi:MAG: sigma-70 family RNA polymerase sigma factor [Oscillospiraceae bacterium]|nr:sigma-70 family RNA polymerase sigma factor [Oscillospiraceae bacterium]
MRNVIKIKAKPDYRKPQAPAASEQFREIYNESFSRIYNYIFFRVRNTWDAEDLTADVFVKAFEYIDSFDSEKGKISTWLGSIARNILNDYFRRSSVRSSLLTEFPEDMSAGIDIDDECLTREAVRVLFEQMKTLPELHQEIMSMKYMLCLKNSEIAEVLSMSEGNVKVTVHRIIAGLRKKMSDWM